MSHCAMLFQWQATPLLTALFAKGDHILNTSSLQKVRGQVSFNGIFIPLGVIWPHIFRRAVVPSVDAAAVCEVTGDALLRSIF